MKIRSQDAFFYLALASVVAGSLLTRSTYAYYNLIISVDRGRDSMPTTLEPPTSSMARVSGITNAAGSI